MAGVSVKWIMYTVQGRNGPGPISIVGLNVGDVLGVVQYNDHGRVIASHEPFEPVVTVTDQIQQTALTDLSMTLPFFVYTVG